MKKRLFFIVMLAVMSIGQAMAGANTYFSKLTVKSKTAEGLVYLEIDENNVVLPSVYSGSITKTHSQSSIQDSVGASYNKYADVPFYAYAKPNYGYKFQEWSSTDDIVSYEDPAKAEKAIIYVRSTALKDEIMPEATVQAVFVKNEKSFDVTYLPSEGLGSYATTGVVNYPKITPGVPVKTHDNYTLTITANPLNGYGFYRWYEMDAQGNKTYLEDTNATITRSFTKETKIGAEFKAGYFKVADEYYMTLTEAISAALKSPDDKVVKMIGDYTLESNAFIPKGVTLLIPFDADNTCYEEEPENYGFTSNANYTTPSLYKTLTLAPGVHLNVSGAVSVSAKIAAGNGGSKYAGCVQGPYGHIKMEKGSNITLVNGANLYAWGYITGEGDIVAQSGSTVYENFQFTDFRGGNSSTGLAGNVQKVFPLNQYYIQNIEASLKIEYGATENLYSCVSIDRKPVPTSATFVSSTEGLFILSKGSSLVKKYDANTDRIEYILEGSAKIGGIEITQEGKTVSSVDYVLPLTNNMTVKLNPNSKLTVDNDVAMLPGFKLIIDEGAEFQLGVEKTPDLFVYDHDTWFKEKYCFTGSFIPLTYSPTRVHTRVAADLPDASIDVNGKFIVNGHLYSTANHTALFSSKGTGSVQFGSEAGELKSTYQSTQTGNEPSYSEIPVQIASLQNRDGECVSTSDVKNGDIYYNVGGFWHLNKKSGDVNSDGRVDIKDIVTLVNIINGKSTDTFGNADANEDGKVDAEDVKVLEKLILWK